MKNLFQPEAVHEITDRFEKLSPQSTAKWGKMNVGQMLAHCAAALEMATGDKKLPRLFIGRILGPFVKANYVGEKPFPQNSPTAKEFIITDERDFETEKKKVLNLIDRFSKGGVEKCTTNPHSFFGKLTPDEWSVSMYKHLDHHLRQFGA